MKKSRTISVKKQKPKKKNKVKSLRKNKVKSLRKKKKHFNKKSTRRNRKKKGGGWECPICTEIVDDVNTLIDTTFCCRQKICRNCTIRICNEFRRCPFCNNEEVFYPYNCMWQLYDADYFINQNY